MNSLNSITSNKNEEIIKHQFKTREGTYQKLNYSDYSHSLNKSFNGNTTLMQSSIGIKCSFCSIQDASITDQLICFNNSREIYVYSFHGVNKTSESNVPIDKRVYKGVLPTCHDFNQYTANIDSIELLVGFNTGQIQLFDPFRKEISKFFNGERTIDTEKVTCVKWVPNSENQFFVSHSSGQLYLYKEDLICDNKSPTYQIFKSGDGYSIYTCKTKSTQNPLFRWVIGQGALNEFAFSPCGKYLATVSQDGFLRVFDHNTMELVGRLRSYFGGLLCVCWSPDSRLIATGGEDDLVTVWSFVEKRVIAKGRGHRSWVSVVAFDQYTTCLEGFDKLKAEIEGESEDTHSIAGSLVATSEEKLIKSRQQQTTNKQSHSDNQSCTHCTNNCSQITCPNNSTPNGFINTYRLASAGQDTQLCYWEISDDVLKQSIVKSRTSILSPSLSNHQSPMLSNTNEANATSQTQSDPNSSSKPIVQNSLKSGFLNLNLVNGLGSTTSSNSSSNMSNNTSSKTTINNKSDISKKEHKRNFSLNSKHHSEKNQNKANQQSKIVEEPAKLLGTAICPRLEDVCKLEPLVCKKISHERISSLTFCEDCFVVACSDVSIWARPSYHCIENQSPSLGYENIVDELADENGSTVV